MNASTSIKETVPTVQCLVFVRILCSQRAVLTQSTEITSLCRQLVSNAVSKISSYTMYLSKYLTIYSSTSTSTSTSKAQSNPTSVVIPNVHPVECLNVGTLYNNRVQHMRAWPPQSKQTKFSLFKVHFPPMPMVAIDFMFASLPLSPCALC